MFDQNNFIEPLYPCILYVNRIGNSLEVLNNDTKIYHHKMSKINFELMLETYNREKIYIEGAIIKIRDYLNEFENRLLEINKHKEYMDNFLYKDNFDKLIE